MSDHVQRFIFIFARLDQRRGRASPRRGRPNELPASSSPTLLATAAGVLGEPMFLLLITASAIYLVLGDLRDALILVSSIVVIVAITIYQERRTDRALEALRDLSSPRALVIRDGVEHRVAGRDLRLARSRQAAAAPAHDSARNDWQTQRSLITAIFIDLGQMASYPDHRLRAQPDSRAEP